VSWRGPKERLAASLYCGELELDFGGCGGVRGGEVGWVVEGSSSSKDAKADTGSSENVGESAAFFWGEVLSIKDSMISTAVSKWDELMAC